MSRLVTDIFYRFLISGDCWFPFSNNNFSACNIGESLNMTNWETWLCLTLAQMRIYIYIYVCMYVCMYVYCVYILYKYIWYWALNAIVYLISFFTAKRPRIHGIALHCTLHYHIMVFRSCLGLNGGLFTWGIPQSPSFSSHRHPSYFRMLWGTHDLNKPPNMIRP